MAEQCIVRLSRKQVLASSKWSKLVNREIYWNSCLMQISGEICRTTILIRYVKSLWSVSVATRCHLPRVVTEYVYCHPQSKHIVQNRSTRCNDCTEGQVNGNNYLQCANTETCGSCFNVNKVMDLEFWRNTCMLLASGEISRMSSVLEPL